MNPIPQRLMPNTVTIYNVHKDEKTGKNAYFRTFLEFVRIMAKKSAVQVAAVGWSRVVTMELWIDPVTSIAFVRDEDGNQITKVYADAAQWSKLSDAEKQAHWTLQEGDYVVTDGECEITIPPNTITELNAERPRKLQGIAPVFDRDGSIHHWEVELV